MRTAIYARVSTVTHSQQHTLEEQLNRLRASLLSRGEAVADEHIFRDEGRSGAPLNRPAHRRLQFSISVDKHAAYPKAFGASQDERVVPKDCNLRRVKYLNNVIEQDHRFVKKKVRASQCFKAVPHGGTNSERH